VTETHSDPPGPEQPEAGRPRRFPTVKDVAAASGVSTATVVRVLQSSALVRPETSKRVLDAVAALGYEPDLHARALVKGRSGVLGLLVPSLSMPYWGELAASVETSAAARGRTLMVASSQRSPRRERSMLQSFTKSRVDALIVAGFFEDAEWWADLNKRQITAVLVDWDLQLRRDFYQADPKELSAALDGLNAPLGAAPPLSHLSFDEDRAGGLIASHLIDLGHRDIVFLGPTVRSVLMFFRGLWRECQRLGCTGIRGEYCEDTARGGLTTAAKLLSQTDRPTAIVGATDAIATGVLAAAAAAGLRVPADLSIAGHDDVATAEFLNPALTTIRTSRHLEGQLAVDLALGLAPDLPPDGALPVELMVRRSTGPIG
jgi:LacI family transcriptional regulator